VKKSRVVVAGVVIVGSLGWVAANGLTGSLVYYKTPTEVARLGSEAVGQRIRLGGLVDPGSVRREGTVTRFILSDGTTRMSVVDTGSVPALFRDGRGVVVEGVVGADGSFHADQILVKHNDSYSPPKPGETPHSADVGS
jgi:cytochrome c-type biogenesis protein CcmE